MVDNSIEITWETFIKHVMWTEIRDHFDYYSWKSGRGFGLHIKDDYAVSFKRGKLGDKKCYFIQHSGIEYMWLEKEDDG
jgi:hypothetical protein